MFDADCRRVDAKTVHAVDIDLFLITEMSPVKLYLVGKVINMCQRNNVHITNNLALILQSKAGIPKDFQLKMGVSLQGKMMISIFSNCIFLVHTR